MTDLDEKLLTMSKAKEVARGDLDGDALEHVAISGGHTRALSFVENALGRGQFANTDLGSIVRSTFETDALEEAIETGDTSLAASIIGITEQELDASSLTVAARLVKRLEADGTLTTVLGAGRPNTGKSNTMFLLAADLSRQIWDDCLVISNSHTWTGDDVTVSSMYELLQVLLDHRDRPKTFVFDEASRYMDERQYSYEVSSQYTPAVKAFSKLGVEVAGHIGHTGKDVSPAMKRLTNLAFWKEAPAEAQFFAKWPGEADRPTEPLFDADLTQLEPTATEYDPDDVASWSWNLDPEIWDGFRDWDHFADRLEDLGPSNS